MRTNFFTKAFCAQEEDCTKKLQSCLYALVAKNMPIGIGNTQIFPKGWPKPKGRHFWKIIEEAVIQHVEAQKGTDGLINVERPQSDIAIYDFKCTYTNKITLYVNVKAVCDQEDQPLKQTIPYSDVSKLKGLLSFYESHPHSDILIAEVHFGVKKDPSLCLDLKRIELAPLRNLSFLRKDSANRNLQAKISGDPQYQQKRTKEAFINILKNL